jgi:signal transduction histidine kinase
VDVVLGASLVFISVFSFIAIIFINRFVLSEWYAFCLVMLCIGVMVLSYSTFFHSTYKQIGEVAYHLFDIASNLLLPSLFYFFEKVFGAGPKKVVSRFKYMHFYLSSFYIGLKLIGLIFPTLNIVYVLIAPILFGSSLIISIIVLVVVLIILCRKKSKEAVIITIGFSGFALSGVSEIILYFANTRMYQFNIWKIGVFLFLASLMIVLVRRAIHNYKQVIAYSKQLEVFNIELQRSEKMEMVSQLAASVAHEVRNPLQVTRGFLQLLRQRTLIDKDKDYMLLAIEELDRASEIITDFLTFAKPGTEMNTVINIREELQQIEAILVPYATMQGVTLRITRSFDAKVKGNSSKFKQAILNIIKNSLEAIGNNGMINISINELTEEKEVHICIEDNGVGMEKHVVSQLGEPFYSQKSKGTGLGLMVTFRIIEAMNGRIIYESEKDKGTRVNMFFPRV